MVWHSPTIEKSQQMVKADVLSLPLEVALLLTMGILLLNINVYAFGRSCFRAYFDNIEWSCIVFVRCSLYAVLKSA